MDILVSFCNVKAPGQAALGLLHADTFAFRVPRLPGGLTQPVGITGLAASPRYVYAALQGSPPAPSELLVLDRSDLALARHYVFRSVVDAHSLYLSGDVLYVVSTGTDEVIALQMRGPDVVSESVFWRPEPAAPRADNHHLNAVVGWRGDLLVSGFGRKAGPRWGSATDGFIVNLTRGERLAAHLCHPHSLAPLGDTVACCESAKMAVRVVGGGRVQSLPGYTRGLCLAGEKLFAGTSIGRQVSKSTGVINNPAQSGVPAGRCTVSRLSADTLAVEGSVDLSAYATEIYDLLPVAGTGSWPTTSGGGPQVFDLTQEVAALVPAGDAFILVDEDQWATGPTLAGRRRFPFLERDGCYWGPPADDATAIRELGRLRRLGATFMVFGWPAFWWLDYYAGLRHHLRSNFRCVQEDDRLIVFDLRPLGPAERTGTGATDRCPPGG